MTLLESVAMTSPVNLHGIQVRYITAKTPIIRSNGDIAPGWELYLHAEWGSVVVVQGSVTALVPLHNVESMVLAASVSGGSAVSGPASGPSRASVGPGPVGPVGPGRPRTKRLALL